MHILFLQINRILSVIDAGEIWKHCRVLWFFPQAGLRCFITYFFIAEHPVPSKLKSRGRNGIVVQWQLRGGCLRACWNAEEPRPQEEKEESREISLTCHLSFIFYLFTNSPAEVSFRSPVWPEPQVSSGLPALAS